MTSWDRLETEAGSEAKSPKIQVRRSLTCARGSNSTLLREHPTCTVVSQLVAKFAESPLLLLLQSLLQSLLL